MARAESKMVMGYLPIEERHHAAILSLIAPATPATRLLDPFAGEGEFLEVAAKAWNVTPYANELDGERADKCIARFGPTQAIRCDVERQLASNEAFGIIWANPPYDHDRLARNNKRVEFAYLRHSWKWAQDGAIVLWAVYNQHITEDAAMFLSKHSSRVEVWALPGKHLGEYDQVVVVAIKGAPANLERLYEQIMAGKAVPRPLTVQPEPIYHAPTPPDPETRFVFAPDTVDDIQGLRLVQSQGAWKSNGFQALLEVPRPPEQIEPIVPPRPGHLALVLAAGVADGAVIRTEEHGRVAVRGKTVHVEEIARVETEVSPHDPAQTIKRTTMRMKPTTTLTLLADNGELVQMEGDDDLLKFITDNKKALAAYLNGKFKPMYQFDMNGLGGFLGRIRLKGKHPLYTAQKHVVGAVTRGLQGRDGVLLVGAMGTGKTAMGGSVAVAIGAGVVSALKSEVPNDNVILIVAPPHLIDKWEREVCSISTQVYVERIEGKGEQKAFEALKGFMDRAAKMGGGIAKIGLIKRDTTKLGASREPAILWKLRYKALWKHGAPTPDGYESKDRVQKERIPLCPHCGMVVTQEAKAGAKYATDTWLRAGKRTCDYCLGSLWQEARAEGSKPKPGTKYAPCNPRYRLDQYLKRMYPERVYLLVWDEAHEAQHGDTGNGEAFIRMAGLSKKVLAMTGTPFNGRSSSLFNLEYALNLRVRQRYAWGGAERLARKVPGRLKREVVGGDSRQRGRAESRWVAEMGVRERVLEERPSYDRDSGAYTGTNTYERPYEEAPGISPLLVAELLDHAIYFSLQDLGKWLPSYEEIALSVPMDGDAGAEYASTREYLKKYLIDRRWEGDTTFRGAYLQWAMNWPDAAFRPCDVVHNMKHPITGEKLPHTITRLKAYGEDRIYPKEQQLIDLVRDELTADRAVVIFVRQTDTKDIQPRLAELIRRHVPLAKPFILKNTVAADRRERVIEAEVAKGTNVLIANPELCKTGLDLVFASSLIFYEITFNLSTMMQAAGRSLRLNQTRDHCKTYYLYYAETMEETAVHLMSRKQRAAKLLNGDIGLTGLDVLTEGEAGLEEALLAAIGKEESLVNPGELFKANGTQTEIDAEDAAYWNVEAMINEMETQVDTPSLQLPTAVPLLLAAPQLELEHSVSKVQAIAAETTKLEAVAVIQDEVSQAVEPELSTADALRLLAAELGATLVEVDPFKRPSAAPPPKKTIDKATRRRKPGIMDVPMDIPAPPPKHIPETLPLFLTRRVEPGIQIPLF
jgi:superfamily II DNA or RNA helicase/16S rRNA G966 N2-methylase RsmD